MNEQPFKLIDPAESTLSEHVAERENIAVLITRRKAEIIELEHRAAELSQLIIDGVRQARGLVSGTTEIVTRLGPQMVTLRDAHAKLHVTDHDKVPADYVRDRTEAVRVKLDTKAAKAALAAGANIPGVELVDMPATVSIKPKGV